MNVLNEVLMDTLQKMRSMFPVPTYTAYSRNYVNMSCRDCSGSCSGSCAGDCEYSCAGECEASCGGAYEGGCTGSCDNSCSGGCDRTFGYD